MVHLPYLQAFEDVNKRVSRLAANIPLIRYNLCPLSFVEVPKDLYSKAILGVYELRRVELLREVFVWAYKRSCARYSAVRQSLGQPHPIRFRYRLAIFEITAIIVRGKLNKSAAVPCIVEYSKSHIAQSDQALFIEVVETELLHLHEGNFARYRISPLEYTAWKKVWEL
jgi:hypothetical protein